MSKADQNKTYLPAIYLREANINIAAGTLSGFENSLNNAISSSLSAFGETSTTYAETLIKVADVYNNYGNYRLARGYVDKALEVLTKNGQLNDQLKGQMALVEAEAMIGQGYCNDAIALLNQMDTYFSARAVEKETIVVDGQIKSQRVPENELFSRFNEYAKLKTLLLKAYQKKGRLSVIGAGLDNPDVETVISDLEKWLSGKRKYLGTYSLAEVEYRYYWAEAYIENGNKSIPRGAELYTTLNDLKRITNPTNALAHKIYLTYLGELIKDQNRGRYMNAKLEYQKVIDKYFSKESVHRLNLTAVEFNAKLAKDKIKDLESDARNVLNSPYLPKNYFTTVSVLEFLKEAALAGKKYNNVETYLMQISEVKKELCGEQSPEYHLSLVDLANFYLDFTNKFDEAGKIYESSFQQVVLPQYGNLQKNALINLNHMASWYELKDEYQKATETLQLARNAVLEKYNFKDINYAIENTNIARLQLRLGLYDEAGESLKTALSVIGEKENRDLEEWRPSYISALETQAKLYGIKGMFDEAEANLDQSARLISRAKSEVISIQSTAEELTPLLVQLGLYSEADKLVNIQIPEYEGLYGKQSIRLIEPLVNKGRILLAKGDYTQAEQTALRANQIALTTYSERSTKTAPTQKLLSDIYYTLGDYDKAQSLVELTLKSQEAQFGREHIEVAKSLSQLALIKFHKGDDPKEAEKLMVEAKDIMEKKLGKENPQYAEVLKNVAVLYIAQKRFDLAFNSLTVAEGIWRAKTGTTNNINAASIYTLTGDVYYQLKNYKRAEEFYTQAKDLYEKFFSKAHPEYVKVLSKLSKVNYMKKEYKISKRFIEESMNNYENFIKQYFPALSEREKAKYWNTIKGDFEFYNTLAFSNLEDFKDLTGKIYNYQLLTKALLLNSSIKIRERILNSTDEELKSKYNDWIQKKEQLTLALSMSPAQLAENEINPVTLQQEVERLEKELSQKSELFGQSFEDKRITFEEVTKSLKPNEVAIEMVRYRYFDHALTDSVIYAALYVKADMQKPKAIFFKDGKRMETRYFKYYRNCITGKIEDRVSYDVFWKPIKNEIGQVSNIYLSADGIYNQINLESIPTPDGKFIIDNNNIVLVSNTKDLYIKKIKSSSSSSLKTASVFGNPTFYATTSSAQAVSALPGTEKEVSQVKFMLNQKGWTTADFVETLATEENVKELDNPKIFHIATHGFYRPSAELKLEDEIEGNEAALNQNPLLRTGLLLKGAGDLMEKTKYNYNMENGILTAYEAMNLNLDKTDLVVLSACETGLGDIEAGEGVYGLQRAFLVAGAKILIMSMFKVDDEATQQLMLKFYQKWLNTGNMRESFVEAKKELRTDFPEPLFWGAFIMIGLE